MSSTLVAIILSLIIINIDCGKVENLYQNLLLYYHQLHESLNFKICDESTINGVLNYDQNFIHKITECEKLKESKVENVKSIIYDRKTASFSSKLIHFIISFSSFFLLNILFAKY
jgi:hypothetical protein